MAEGSWLRLGPIDAHLDARTVNSIIKDALGRRAESITQNPEVRQKIGEAFIDAVTPFVPVSNKEKATHLVDSGRATDDGRVYWTAINKRGDNYAGYVYDQEETRWPDGEYLKPSKPGTYPRWVEKVHPGTAEWDTFVNNITPIIKEAFAKYD
jgi:hypothetical protein